MPTDVSSVVNALQTQNTILTNLVRLFQAGVIIQPAPANYTVAALPTTAATGAYAYATNGRKPGEGAGAGTGIPVFFNSGTNTWFSYSSALVVTS